MLRKVVLPEQCYAPQVLSRVEVLVLGFPTIRGWTVRSPISQTGIVASDQIVHPNMGPLYMLDIDPGQGLSGSPVMRLDTEEVIGLVHGPGNVPRDLGFELAAPISKQDYETAIDKIAQLDEEERQMCLFAGQASSAQDQS